MVVTTCARARLPILGVSLLVAILSSPEMSAADATAPDLLEVRAAASTARRAADGRAVVRRRSAGVRPGVLIDADGSPRLRAGDRVRLNLFDDVNVVATITNVARTQAGYTWGGRLDGIDRGHAVLAVHGDAVVGSVVLPKAVYRIGYAADGTPVVEEVDAGALPDDAAPVVPPVVPAPRALSDTPATVSDSGTQIDVMVVYTATARAAAGGTAAMLAEVDMAVASANQAYASNGLVQRLRLVFAAETAITESPNPDHQTAVDADLAAVKGDARIAWLRDVTRADVVSLFTNHGSTFSFCGIAYLLADTAGFSSFAFSVVERDCASANLTFAHEVGHNMGAHHDPASAGGLATLFPYSHGHVDLVSRVRTIMAANTQCAALQFNCVRIPLFSTPALTFAGRPIGTAEASDNARTLGQTSDTVAVFRQSLTSPTTLLAAVNQPAFAAGQTVTATVGLTTPGAGATVDIYLGVLVPDGSVAFFTPGGGVALGSVTNLASLRPVAAGVSLGTPISVAVPYFSYRWTGNEPRGGYVLFMLAVNSGPLTPDALAAGGLVASALAAFTF